MKMNLIRNLLRIGAVGGVIGTAYFSAKNGLAICERCKEVKQEARFLEKPKRITHYIKRAPYLAKPLLPTIGCAAGSIVCMAASERISYKQIAALTATCAYLAKNRDFLENKLKEVVGEEKLQEIKKEFIIKEAPKMVSFPSVEETGKGSLLCLEGYSGRWFRSSEEACIEAQEYLQKVFEEDKRCCLNDYYAFLGITMTQFGHEKGWVNDPDWYGPELRFTNTYLEPCEWDDLGPDFQPVNEPVYVLEIDIIPMDCWQEI